MARLTKVILFALSSLGFWTLWGFPARNNLLTFLGALHQPGALVPGPTRDAMKQTWTGLLPPLDRKLTELVGFFYTAIDGNRIDVSLNFFNLGSQVLAAWILITTEAYRAGNQGIASVTYITIFGLLVALIGYACVAPLFFILHLSYAKTAREPKAYNLILNTPVRLALVPLSVGIGFGIPSVMMTLPAPKFLSVNAKLTWTGIQQGWPLWIYLSQKVLEAIVSTMDPMVTMRTEAQKRTETVTYMRHAYLTALLSSAGAHLLYVTAALVALVMPSALSSKLAVQLHPATFVVPVNPFGDERAKTLAEGALWFLQWDLIVGAISTMIWGIAVRLMSVGKMDSVGAWMKALLKYGAVATVVGPAGAAVVAIWGRDEQVLKAEKDKQ